MEAANPYESPRGGLATASGGTGEVKLFSLACRIGRLRYIARLTTATLVAYLLSIVLMLYAMATVDASGGPISAILLLMLTGLAVIVVSTIFAVQRLHDLNAPGWLCLILFVPLANLLLSLYLMLWPGSSGANGYGGPPPANRWYHWVGGLMLPVVFGALGVMAAVALPAYQGYVERAGQMQQAR